MTNEMVKLSKEIETTKENWLYFLEDIEKNYVVLPEASDYDCLTGYLDDNFSNYSRNLMDSEYNRWYNTYQEIYKLNDVLIGYYMDYGKTEMQDDQDSIDCKCHIFKEIKELVYKISYEIVK